MIVVHSDNEFDTEAGHALHANPINPGIGKLVMSRLNHRGIG